MTDEAEKDPHIQGILHSIEEMAWMVGRTGKPLGSIPLFSEDAAEVCEEAKEIAERHGIRMEMDVSDDKDADVEFPAVQLLLFREQIIRDTYLYLTNDLANDDIPSDVEDCLWGLLYGYRSDAIQQYVDWQRSRWENYP